MYVIELTDGKISLDRFGNADILEGIEAEKQILRNALLIFKGSWFDDLTRGPDWLTILGKRYTINQIKSEIKRVLNALSIVDTIFNVNLGDPNPNREVVLNFVVKTISGNTVTFSEAV